MMCLSEVTMSIYQLLFQRACTIKIQTKHVGLVQSGHTSSRQNAICPRHDTAENCSLLIKQQALTHSLYQLMKECQMENQ
jgi:hypothetical protein